MLKVVIDTNVYISSLLGPQGPSRDVIRKCLEGVVEPQMGLALFQEYEDVISRERIKRLCKLTDSEQRELFDAFISVCRWVEVYYAWRPNLKDEGDNHLIELAVASGAKKIVTQNVKDFIDPNLLFDIAIVTPEMFLEEF